MDIGGDLRRARIARNQSLQNISQRTKITTALLRAIEENRFDRMPGGLFTRGYLRAYAREVRLEPEAIVDQYRAAFEQPVPPQEPTRHDDRSSRADDLNSDQGERANSIAGVAIVLLIGFGYFTFARSVATSSTRDEAPKAPDAVTAVTGGPAPVSTSGTVESPTGPLKLSIRTTGDCWVAATIDGTRALARLMKAGEQTQLSVSDAASIRVGDPATFTFTIDGAPGRALGMPGAAVTLNFNRQNYKTALSHPAR